MPLQLSIKIPGNVSSAVRKMGRTTSGGRWFCADRSEAEIEPLAKQAGSSPLRTR